MKMGKKTEFNPKSSLRGGGARMELIRTERGVEKRKLIIESEVEKKGSRPAQTKIEPFRNG